MSTIAHPFLRRLRLMSGTLVLIILAGCVAAIVYAQGHSVEGSAPEHRRSDLTGFINHVLVPARLRADDSVAATPNRPCALLDRVVTELNDKLLIGIGVRVDPGNLLMLADKNAWSCDRVARRLAAILDNAVESRALLMAMKTDRPLPDSVLSTPSAWRIVGGCSQVFGRPLATNARSGQCGTQEEPALLEAVLADGAARQWLGDHLSSTIKRPGSNNVLLAGKVFPRADDVSLTLQPGPQALTEKVVACATQTAVDMSACPRRGRVQLLAPMAAIVMIDTGTGAVVAASGAWSECARHRLEEWSTTLDAVTNSLPCAVLPDRRIGSTHRLAQLPSWLELVPIGSGIKVIGALASIRAGLVNDTNHFMYREALAYSRNDLFIEAAVSSGALLAEALQTTFVRGSSQAFDGTIGSGSVMLRGANPLPRGEMLAYKDYASIREHIRRAPAQAYQTHVALMGPYARTHEIATEAIGGRSAQTSAYGLASLWYGIDRAASGSKTAPVVHIAERHGARPEIESIWLTPREAKLLLDLTSKVSKGTGRPACSAAVACAADVSGKTGTADFLQHEGGQSRRLTATVPSKTFGAVFTATDGRRYAVGAVAFRRVDAKGHLSMENPAAELAYEVIAELAAVKPTVSRKSAAARR